QREVQLRHVALTELCPGNGLSGQGDAPVGNVNARQTIASRQRPRDGSARPAPKLEDVGARKQRPEKHREVARLDLNAGTARPFGIVLGDSVVAVLDYA